MGACTNKQDREDSKSPSGIPDCFYFSRSKGKLINIHNKKVQKIHLESKLFCSKDSAIGYLSKKRIILIGGSSDSCLICKVSTLNLTNMEIIHLPDIPIPCKQGQVHEIGEWIYYIGGLTTRNNEVVPATIFRFSQKQNIWQEIKEPNKANSTFKFSALKNFGSCVMDKKIFIFGGERLDKLGNLKSSKLILSLTVDQGFVLKTESKLPIKVNNPIVAAGENHAIVVGGTDPKTGGFNYKSFYVLLKENGMKVNIMDPLNMKFIENFPPIYTNQYAVFISYPNVAVRYKNLNFWKTFHIKGKKQGKSGKVEKKSEVKVPEIAEEVKVQEFEKGNRSWNPGVSEGLEKKLKKSKQSSSSQNISASDSKISFEKDGELNLEVSADFPSFKKSVSKSSSSNSSSSKSSSSKSSSSKGSSSKSRSSRLQKKSKHSIPSAEVSKKFSSPDYKPPNITISALDSQVPSEKPSHLPKIPLLDLTFNPKPQLPIINHDLSKNPVKKLLLHKKSSSSSDRLFKGKNDAHEITILIPDNKSSGCNQSNIKITKPENYKNIETSSSDDSIRSISLTSSRNKSGSKILESSNSDSEDKNGNVADFLRLNDANSSRRSSRDKDSKRSDPSPASLPEEIEKKQYESSKIFNKNLYLDDKNTDKIIGLTGFKDRPTSPSIPILSGKIDLRLPIAGTPKGNFIEQRVRTPAYRKSSDGIVVIPTKYSEDSEDSDENFPRPSHPPTSRPVYSLIRPGSKIIAKSVVKTDKNQIRLTPKGMRMAEKACSVLVSSIFSSDDFGAGKNTKAEDVPNFVAEDEVKPEKMIENNEESKIGKSRPSKSSSSESSSSESSSSESSSSESNSLNSKVLVLADSPEKSSRSSSDSHHSSSKVKKSASSVSSSDISDTENEETLKFSQLEGHRFLQLISSTLKLNPFFSVPSSLHLADMNLYLLQMIPCKSFTLTEELFRILSLLHETANKSPLTEKEKWNIVMCSGLLPENTEITGQQLAFALSRSFKYILLRKS